MELPYLGGLLTPADVQSKGTGRYAADYVAWAKTMALINQHAPGWWPEIGETHYMADTTAYVDIRFVHPERCTPWFPYAITDNPKVIAVIHLIMCASFNSLNYREFIPFKHMSRAP